MWSEIIAAAVGSLMTFIGYKYKNRVQTMKCYMHPDDILSKISSVIDGVEYNNIYIKEFTLKNTTNKDIESFMVIISFDNNASVIEFHNDSKEGNDWHHMHIDPKYKNRVLAKVVNFNRDDTIRFRIRVGDVTVNNCKVVESGCTGFKIKIVYNKKMI